MTYNMHSEKLQSSFQKFGELLDVRFSKGVFTTEDSVRYTFFDALHSELGTAPEDIILEAPHPYIERKKMDMLIPEREDSPEIVCEFKFHGKLPSEQHQPRTQKAGELFVDISRLAIYKKKRQKTRCFLVYVTEFEMANYLSNDANRLDDFFNLLPDETLRINAEYFDNRPETFTNAAGVYGIEECDLSHCFSISRDLQNKYFVRVFEIS